MDAQDVPVQNQTEIGSLQRMEVKTGSLEGQQRH